MFEEYNTELADVREKLRLRDKWNSQIHKFEADLADEEARLHEAESILNEQQEQLARVQGITITHLFHKLLGHQTEKVEESEKRLLQAKLKYDAAVFAVRELKQDIDDLRTRIAPLSTIDTAYEELITRKERALLSLGTESAREIYRLSHEEAELRSELKELSEALEAAKRAYDVLGECLVSLDKAKDWGTLDMFGGGMITTAIKRDRMNDAQDQIHQAQHLLQRLQKELQDVHMDLNIQVSESGFLHFADYFFDGLIVDWMVQNQLQDATAHVTEQHSVVGSIHNKLAEQKRQLDTRLDDVERERRQRIESYQ